MRPLPPVLLAVAATAALAVTSTAQAQPPPSPLFIGGRVAPPPSSSPSDGASSPAACVTVTALTSDGQRASSEACPGDAAADGAGWPFVLSVPLVAPPPVAVLVTARAGEGGRVWRRVVLATGTAADVSVEWEGGDGAVVDGRACAHSPAAAAALVASSLAMGGLAAAGVGLLAWARSRKEGEAGEARGGDGGTRWARTQDGRLARAGGGQVRNEM